VEKKLIKVMAESKSLGNSLGGNSENVSNNASSTHLNNSSSNNSLPHPPPSPTPSSPIPTPQNNIHLQGQVSELLDEVESLKVSLRSRDTNLAAQMQEMDRLRSENRELRRVEERLAHKEKKHRDLKERNKDLVRENEKLIEEAEVAHADNIQTKQSLAMVTEEAKIEQDALRSQYGKQMDDLAMALQRESELSEQLDKYKGEATAHRQNNYEIVRSKDSALADAQKAMQEAKTKLATLELKYDKLDRENTQLIEERKEGAVTKEKLRAEGQRGREYKRQVKELQDRLEEQTRRREASESENVSLKERAKSAEQQNTKLHADMKTLTEKMGREESLLLEASKDKEAIRMAAGGQEQTAKLEAKVSKLEDDLKSKRAENGDLTKEVDDLMQKTETLEGDLAALQSKLVEAERTRDFSLKAAKLAAQASSATNSSEEDKEVVGDLLVKNSKLEEALETSVKKVADLEEEREKLRTAVKALKSKIEAAQMLKKKQSIALEKAQKEASDAKKGMSAGKDVEEAKMLLRGAEIEREASEQKAATAADEVKRLRTELEVMDQKLTGAREKFQIRLKKIESDVKSDKDGDMFAGLRGELEALSRELAAEKANGRQKVKDLQIDLDAHVEAVPLLREMLEKFKNWGEVLAARLKREGITDVPEMPDVEGGDEDEDEDSDLDLSGSLSGSENLSLSTTQSERSGQPGKR
jgi:protein HOOK3